MRIIFIVFTAIILTACGGGGSGGSNTSTITVPAGVYNGTVTPNGSVTDTAVALITSDNKFALVDTDTLEAFIGTVTDNNISGTLFSTSVTGLTGKVTSVSGNNISGTYTSSLGNGQFSLVADPNLFARGANLTSLSGVWVDSVFTTGIGTTTWVIAADGSFTMSSTSSCTATGQFSLINPSDNEYSMTLAVSNCPGANGNYSGIATLGDTYNMNDTLSFMFNNGSVGGLFEPIKQ